MPSEYRPPATGCGAPTHASSGRAPAIPGSASPAAAPAHTPTRRDRTGVRTATRRRTRSCDGIAEVEGERLRERDTVERFPRLTAQSRRSGRALPGSLQRDDEALRWVSP